jgi:acetyltransferase-like isoleucine patch superfamily enzyme
MSMTREITATFGRRKTSVEPAWETECAAWLREKHSTDELVAMFSRVREEEGPLETSLRRAILRAVCRHVGTDIQIGPGVMLKHPETMEIGDCVFIGAQAMIQGRFDGKCRIGNHVWIGPQAYFDARDLVIEDYVGWGPGAKVLGSSHTGDPLDVPIITTNLVIKPVVIGYGADIGVNSVILPGVHVGAHAIVGAGAVVTEDVPDYAVVAGVPARVLRSRRDTR